MQFGYRIISDMGHISMGFPLDNPLAAGVEVGDTFDLSNLVGSKCQVLIQHREGDGKTHANVVAVLKSA
jgi:hypothetical protein